MSQTSRLAALVDKKYSGARQTTSERQYRRRRRRRRRVRCPQQQQQQRSYAISLSAAGKRRHDRSTGPPLAPSLPVINRRRPAGDVRATDRPRFNHLKSVPGGPTDRPAGRLAHIGSDDWASKLQQLRAKNATRVNIRARQ